MINNHLTPTDPLGDVHKFMTACGQSTDHFSARQTGLYIGLQLEELGEKLTEILGPEHPVVQHMHSEEVRFKSGVYDQQIAVTDRDQLLDADFDLAWVSIAAAFSLGANVPLAWLLGAESNLAKIDETTGTVLRDENGKVKKPEGWAEPDFKSALHPIAPMTYRQV